MERVQEVGMVWPAHVRVNALRATGWLELRCLQCRTTQDVLVGSEGMTVGQLLDMARYFAAAHAHGEAT